MIGSKQTTRCRTCGKEFKSFYDHWNLAKIYSERFRDKHCESCRKENNMAWIPYTLEERDYKDLPDDLKENIADCEWESADESERSCILMDLGLPPRDERG